MSDRSIFPPPVKLFISYSRQDYPIVQKIYAQLNAYVSIPVPPEKANQKLPTYQPWLDMVEIKISNQWQAEIQRGLDTCDAVLLIASQYSLASENVRDEWLYAHAKGKPVYVWLIDNAPLDPKLAACPRFDLRADPLDELCVGQAINWLGRTIRSLPADPAEQPAIPWEATVLPAYVSAHRRVLVGVQLYSIVIQALIFFLVALNLYRSATTFEIEGLQVSPLITAPLAALAIVLDWALYVRHIRRLSRRRMPYEHAMLYWVGPLMLKLVIPTLIVLPLSGPLLALAVVQTVAFLIVGWIARRKSPLVMRSRTWRSNPKAPTESRWFPAYPVRGSLRLSPSEHSRLPDDAPPRQVSAGPRWPRQVLVLYDPWDTYFGEYLAAYYMDRVSTGATVIARPVADCEDALPAAERLYLLISPRSVDAMAALVDRPEVQARQFVLVLLQDVDTPDSLSRYQWIDAQSDYRRAFQQVGQANVELPLRPPPRAALFSLAQPHPRAVFFSFLAISWMPLLLCLLGLPILYLYGMHQISPFLPVLETLSFEALALSTLHSLLISYVLVMGYWRRRYSLRLILAAWLIFVASMGDLDFLPLLILGAPIALGLLRMSRLPREVDGVLDGFDWIEMLALGIWRPKKRFEWPLFLALVLLGGILLIGKVGAASIPAAPGTLDAPPALTEYSGPIEVMGLAVGEALSALDDGSQRLIGAGTRFSGIGQVYGVLEVRHIAPGSRVSFLWSLDGAFITEEVIPWDLEVDWSQPDMLGQFSATIVQTDGSLLPAGNYTLVIAVDGARLAETAFTLVP